MTRIFVTGGGSTLGAAVIGLIAEKHHVVALRHRSEVAQAYEIVDGDIARRGDYVDSLRSCERVLHLAALTHAVDPCDYHRTNLDATRVLVEACRDGQHFVFVSSRAAVGGGGAYGESKLAAEAVVAERFASASILRLGEVVAIGSDEGISSLLRLAATRRVVLDLRSRPEVTYAPISLPAAATAIASAIESEHAGTVTVSATEHVTARMLQQSFRRAGHRCMRLPIPVALLRASGCVLAPRFFVVDQLDRLGVPKRVATVAELARLGVDPPVLDEIVTATLAAARSEWSSRPAARSG